LTRFHAGVTEGYPSATATPHTSPAKGAIAGAPSFLTLNDPFSNNLFSSYASDPSPTDFSFAPDASPLKRRREEEPDADIRLRMRRPLHGSDMSGDDDSDSDDDLDIITCSSDSDRVSNRPIRPLRKSSYGPRALSGLSALNAGSFNTGSGDLFSNVPPVRDESQEDQLMTDLN
jgi:hypothetical protein